MLRCVETEKEQKLLSPEYKEKLMSRRTNTVKKKNTQKTQVISNSQVTTGKLKQAPSIKKENNRKRLVEL